MDPSKANDAVSRDTGKNPDATYEAPRLTVLGSLTELTLTTLGGSGMDMGSLNIS